MRESGSLGDAGLRGQPSRAESRLSEQENGLDGKRHRKESQHSSCPMSHRENRTAKPRGKLFPRKRMPFKGRSKPG